MTIKKFLFYKLLVFVFCFSFINNTIAQNTFYDSIKKMSIDEQYDFFYNLLQKGDTLKAHKFSNIFVEIQKQTEPVDYLTLLDGFIFKIESDFKNKDLYLDSINSYSKNLERKIYYPANGYFSIGNELFVRKKFIEALDYLIKSYKMSKESGNYLIEIQSLSTIGIIKLERINDEKEAIKIFKQCESFYNEKYKNSLKENYALLNFNLAEAYRKINKIDSSKYYTNIGYEFSIKHNMNRMKDYFIYEKGINDYLNNNYTGAIQNLQSSYNTIYDNHDFANLIITNFYLGKSYDKIKDKIKSDYHFHVVDSLYLKNKIFIPQVRGHYIGLKNKFKKLNDQSKELYYLNKVLQIDSIYLKEYKIINETFNRKFNHLSLQNEKEELSSRILKQGKSNLNRTILFVLITVILFFVAFKFYNRARIQKKKFLALTDNLENKNSIASNSSQKRNKPIISDSKEKELLDKLKQFEVSEGYLTKNILIKEFSRNVLNSNDKYFRPVLKKHINKTFPQYLNDLRIEYCIKKLKNDKLFRNYTIETLASEVGFNNTTSFYKAFEKYTGLRPYYFINQLNKSKDSTNV